jgi:membrane-bound lytic murein transglycosylase B
MRIRPVAIIAIALFFAPLISISTAAADSKTPAPAIQKTISPKAAYEIALNDFRKEFKVYEESRREINKAFKEAIDKALSDSNSSKSGSQTQVQKRQSMNAKKRAVMDATESRDAAIEALGPPPVAPTPPGKKPSVAKEMKKESEKSPAPKR